LGRAPRSASRGALRLAQGAARRGDGGRGPPAIPRRRSGRRTVTCLPTLDLPRRRAVVV